MMSSLAPEARLPTGVALSREERAAWVAIAAYPGIGPRHFLRLLAHFGSAAEVRQAGPEGWRAEGLVNAGVPCLPRAVWADGETLLRRAEGLGLAVVLLGEPDYPALLAGSPCPPVVLYQRGRLLPADDPAVAVVGTRRASAYGLWTAERLGGELAGEGFTVVSGLARGIDSAAHRGALAAGGRTIAVLGCGLDRVYPRENGPLAERIAGQGALLSEFPPGTLPLPENFLRRNRIIAWLSRATVVVEGGAQSGASNTATHAADAGRDVFAVPGDVGRPGSVLPNRLLREGAKLLERGSQVTEELGHLRLQLPALERPGGPGPHLDDPHDRLLWDALRQGPGDAEELAVRCGLPVGTVSARLVAWELEGWLKAYPDGRLGR
ncbi:MAG: DNA-processing protein DprA [Chitinophagales bacterium]